MKPAVSLNQAVLAVDSSVRYVAVLSRGALSTACRPSLRDSSSAESDRYEELLVNPTILTIAGNRGALTAVGSLMSWCDTEASSSLYIRSTTAMCQFVSNLTPTRPE